MPRPNNQNISPPFIFREAARDPDQGTNWFYVVCVILPMLLILSLFVSDRSTDLDEPSEMSTSHPTS